MDEIHNSITSGHLGIKQTLSRLGQNFYWVGMRKNVEELCCACKVVCATKGSQRFHRAQLQLYLVGTLMGRVAMDKTGPLSLMTDVNRYICVAMNYFTKVPEADTPFMTRKAHPTAKYW